jgi:probable rRNA maturation factor
MIHNRQRRVRVRPVLLEEFFARVRRTLGVPEEAVAICLVSDSAMARLNRRYRGKSGSTDVLSFPAAGGRGKSMARTRASCSSFLGDIAISPETARRNANRLGRPLEHELRILILHGVLHLLGYDHETDDGEMERLERRLRLKLRLVRR